MSYFLDQICIDRLFPSSKIQKNGMSNKGTANTIIWVCHFKAYKDQIVGMVKEHVQHFLSIIT